MFAPSIKPTSDMVLLIVIVVASLEIDRFAPTAMLLSCATDPVCDANTPWPLPMFASEPTPVDGPPTMMLPLTRSESCCIAIMM